MSNIMDYKNMTNVPIYKFEESDIRIPILLRLIIYLYWNTTRTDLSDLLHSQCPKALQRVV